MREFEAISEESQGRPKVVSVGERSELDEVLRHRARRMLVQAVEAEAAACGFAVALRNCHNPAVHTDGWLGYGPLESDGSPRGELPGHRRGPRNCSPAFIAWCRC